MLILPDEPLTDSWQVRWDDEALALRLERFGLTMQNGINGYTVKYFVMGLPLTVPPLNYRAVDRPFDDICHLIPDLELAEILERSKSA